MSALLRKLCSGCSPTMEQVPTSPFGRRLALLRGAKIPTSSEAPKPLTLNPKPHKSSASSDIPVL